jgi:hypothetical protein
MVHDHAQGIDLGILILLVFSAGGETLLSGGQARGSIWESYAAATSKPDKPAPEFTAEPYRRPVRPVFPPAKVSRYDNDSFFGFPRRQDPLFDKNPKPSWRPMTENEPVYDEPAYELPDYDAPYFRLEPVRKPTYEKPFYTLPNDNRPRYDFKYQEAPGYFAPTYNAPVDFAPNFVIKPEAAPVYNRPGYDQSMIHYNQPEYQAPVYRSQEYLKPREVAPPYIKPAD